METAVPRSRQGALLVLVMRLNVVAAAPCSGQMALGSTEWTATLCIKFGGSVSCLGRRALKISASDSQLKTIKSTRRCWAAEAVPALGGRPTALRRGMPPKTLRGMAATASALTTTTSATRAERS
jgi:hypothetical protein